MRRTESDPDGLARIEGALADRCDRACALLVFAGASAVAARLEPPLRPFWMLAALIAAAGAVVAGVAAAAAREERDAVLDRILIAAPAAAHDGPVAGRAGRIGSPRGRARLAGRLDRLVDRSRRGARGECFHTGLVRMHAPRLRAIAARLRAAEAPASAVARLNRLLADPGSPLVAREADVQRFAAWVRQIEIDLATPVPVSSRRAFDRPQARPDRGGAALLRAEPARGRVPGQADGRGGRLRREGADPGGRHRR
jgi:hypothetical protein